MNIKILALFLGIALVIVGGLFVFSKDKTEPVVTDPNATSTPVTTNPTSTTGTVNTVQIAMLDVAGITNGKSRGCDKVVMIDRTVAPTTQPLTAALSSLFTIPTSTVAGWFNFMAKTNATLKFDRATVVSGVATIYLTGQLTGLAGICDDPRAQIQIEETALQFSTVQRVDIYLNGVKTTLTPSER